VKLSVGRLTNHHPRDKTAMTEKVKPKTRCIPPQRAV